LVGYCGFFHHPEHGIEDIEIGYRLNPDYWNRGLATEAARAVRDHGFRHLELPRLISLIHPENTPSRRVAEKEWHDGREGNRVPRFSDAGVCDFPRTVAEGFFHLIVARWS